MSSLFFSFQEYTSTLKNDWDTFLKKDALYKHFFFTRAYLDTLGDSHFHELSFLIYNKKKLIGIIAGGYDKRDPLTYWSHKFLPFGSILPIKKANTSERIKMYHEMMKLLQQIGFSYFIVKTLPSIYTNTNDINPTLWNLSKETYHELNYAIPIGNGVWNPQHRRKRGFRKAQDANLSFKEGEEKDLNPYWHILSNNLNINHKSTPTHNIEQITTLLRTFPANIELITVNDMNHIVGGALLFKNEGIIHAQYIAASAYGKENGALDLLFYEAIERSIKSSRTKWFSLGVCSERSINGINTSLAEWKESWKAIPISGQSTSTFVLDETIEAIKIY